MNNITNNKLPIRKREVGEGTTSENGSSSSGKWMSSKIRLMHKMINSSSNSTATHELAVKVTQKLQYHQLHDNSEVNSFNSSNSNNTMRACSDCNTTTTPLWRSGPRGPKVHSLVLFDWFSPFSQYCLFSSFGHCYWDSRTPFWPFNNLLGHFIGLNLQTLHVCIPIIW